MLQTEELVQLSQFEPQEIHQLLSDIFNELNIKYLNIYYPAEHVRQVSLLEHVAQ